SNELKEINLKSNFLNNNTNFENIKFNFKILGSNTNYEQYVSKINNRLISFNPATMSKSLLETDLVTIDYLNKNLKIRSGNYVVDQFYRIPKGYKLNVEDGVKIDFVKGGGIISYSTINLNGTKSNPIVITSSDKHNKGLTLINTDEVSNFENVMISNLSNYNSDNYNLTGALTFYQSDVFIKQCVISNNISGDDLVNIFKSNFEIIDSSFNNSLSDALDADFCDGKIINSKFVQSGNDAIDISGTSLVISKLLIDTAQDKALSAGENSSIEGSEVTITFSEIGICSKDLSVINLNKFELINNTIGITAFQKKSKFGPGYLNLTNGTLKQNKIDFLVEKNSIAYLNNNILIPNNGNLKDQFYGVKYGKSSK
ncbi:hypothetical protein N9M44_02900, partial [Flavobacteriaceae bacterium]|nr:hypothetical protein [Flavobacteriaceae bacterium]